MWSILWITENSSGRSNLREEHRFATKREAAQRIMATPHTRIQRNDHQYIVTR